MTKLTSLIFISILFAITPAFAKSNSNNSYQNLLLQKAVQLDLANDQDWINMVYYQKSGEQKCTEKSCKSFESIIDDANFFLTKNGKYNPKQELAATIASFFSTQKLPNKNKLKKN